jgi:hypothetical protein
MIILAAQGLLSYSSQNILKHLEMILSTNDDNKIYFEHLDLVLLREMPLFTKGLLYPTHFKKSKFISILHSVCMELLTYDLQ